MRVEFMTDFLFLKQLPIHNFFPNMVPVFHSFNIVLKKQPNFLFFFVSSLITFDRLQLSGEYLLRACALHMILLSECEGHYLTLPKS